MEDKFFNQFRDELYDYADKPDAGTWESIESSIGKSRRKRVGIILISAAAMILAVVIGTIFLTRENGNDQLALKQQNIKDAHGDSAVMRTDNPSGASLNSLVVESGRNNVVSADSFTSVEVDDSPVYETIGDESDDSIGAQFSFADKSASGSTPDNVLPASEVEISSIITTPEINEVSTKKTNQGSHDEKSERPGKKFLPTHIVVSTGGLFVNNEFVANPADELYVTGIQNQVRSADQFGLRLSAGVIWPITRRLQIYTGLTHQALSSSVIFNTTAFAVVKVEYGDDHSMTITTPAKITSQVEYNQTRRENGLEVELSYQFRTGFIDHAVGTGFMLHRGIILDRMSDLPLKRSSVTIPYVTFSYSIQRMITDRLFVRLRPYGALDLSGADTVSPWIIRKAERHLGLQVGAGFRLR